MGEVDKEVETRRRWENLRRVRSMKRPWSGRGKKEGKKDGE